MKKLFTLIVIMLLSANVYAADYMSFTYSFVANELIRAARVMQNYNDLRNSIIDGTKKVNFAQLLIGGVEVISTSRGITAVGVVSSAEVSVNSTLKVSGATTLRSTLVVAGMTTLSGKVSANAGASVNIVQAGSFKTFAVGQGVSGRTSVNYTEFDGGSSSSDGSFIQLFGSNYSSNKGNIKYAPGKGNGTTACGVHLFYNSKTNPNIVMQVSSVTNSANRQVFINDDSNANNLNGLTIQQLAADDSILSEKSSDVNQSMTGVAEADTYGFDSKVSATLGGRSMYGLSDGDGTAAQLVGIMGSADPTDTKSAMTFTSGKYDGGTSYTSLGNNERCFEFQNYSTTIGHVNGQGLWTLPSAYLYQSARDDKIFSLGSSDVSQPFTTIASANEYGFDAKESATVGGRAVRGFTDGDRPAIALYGNMGTASPSGTYPCIKLDGRKTDGGTGETSFAAGENLFELRNYGVKVIDAKGNGDTTVSGNLTAKTVSDNGTLNVGGATTLRGTLGVTGVTTLTGGANGVIGATTPAAGTFTKVSANAGTSLNNVTAATIIIKDDANLEPSPKSLHASANIVGNIID